MSSCARLYLLVASCETESNLARPPPLHPHLDGFWRDGTSVLVYSNTEVGRYLRFNATYHVIISIVCIALLW